VSDATAARTRARRWPLLVVLVVTGAIVGLVVAAGTRPMYTATARSFVTSSSPSSVGDLQQGASFVQQAGQSYAALAKRSYVLEHVITDLHLASTPEALGRRITAQIPIDTVVLSIEVADPSPAQAARIADAVQDRLARTVHSLAPAVTHHSELVPIERAVPPTVPSSPSVPVDGVLGALGGAAVWLLMALVVAARRRRPPAGDGLAAPSML
jgi:succinoglycan biosynthesis transport protein ExoP